MNKNHSRIPAYVQRTLQKFARDQGLRWRAILNLAWQTGNYPDPQQAQPLQWLRNAKGPTWLMSSECTGVVKYGPSACCLMVEAIQDLITVAEGHIASDPKGNPLTKRAIDQGRRAVSEWQKGTA